MPLPWIYFYFHSILFDDKNDNDKFINSFKQDAIKLISPYNQFAIYHGKPSSITPIDNAREEKSRASRQFPRRVKENW